MQNGKKAEQNQIGGINFTKWVVYYKKLFIMVTIL